VTALHQGYIDIVCNVFTPEAVSEGRTGLDEAFKEQVRMPPQMRAGVTVDDYLKRMDAAGIERSLLIAIRCGDLRMRSSFEIPYTMVAEICAQHPDRFSGLAGIDPTRGMQGLRDLEQGVREYGFVGAHWYLTQTVRTIIRAAASWDWTRFDPPYIKPLPLPSGRTRWLTRAEAADLLIALPSPISEMAALSLETGLRKANIRDLKWQWVNDEILHIPGPSVKTRQDLIVPLSQKAKLIIEARARSRFGEFVFHKQGRKIDRPAG
jgi:hypothetical protein